MQLLHPLYTGMRAHEDKGPDGYCCSKIPVLDVQVSGTPILHHLGEL